jgi:hypothetical protein
MAVGAIKRMGPAFLSNSAANIYTPPASPIYTVIRHIHVANVTSASATCSVYVGATGGSAAGTEIFKDKSIAAKDTFDYYCGMRMSATDFLTGIASASSTLVITVEGEVAVVVS